MIAKDFAAQWFRPEIDLCELAKLRKAGWTIKRLAEHFGRPKTSIVERLARLEKKAGSPLGQGPASFPGEVGSGFG